MRSFASFAFLAAAFLAPAVAAAAEMSVGGSVTYTIVPTQPVKLESGTTILTLIQSGIVRADDPASPLHLSAHDCLGTLAFQEEGAFGAGTCVARDKDGDVWWLWWTSDGRTGGTWEAMSGTGKYEGVTGSGTTTFEANFPDRSAIAYEGTLTLK